jgi:hypothetical protein
MERLGLVDSHAHNALASFREVLHKQTGETFTIIDEQSKVAYHCVVEKTEVDIIHIGIQNVTDINQIYMRYREGERTYKLANITKIWPKEASSMKDSFTSTWERIKKSGAELFEQLPEKVKEVAAEKEIKGKGLAEKAKAMIGEVPGTIKQTVSELGIPVPITEGMIKKALERAELDDISNLVVYFVDDTLVIEGKTKKLAMSISFSFVLRPQKSLERQLFLDIMEMKPLNIGWINKKIFTQPPYVTCEGSTICLDLDGFDVIKKIPVGTIQSFQIENDKLWVKISL